VLPSRAEGVPRTVLEAMASGTPVVTSQLEQIKDIVDAGGQTVEPMSDGALGGALVESLNGTVTDGGQAVENHRWQSTVEETTACLDSTVY